MMSETRSHKLLEQRLQDDWRSKVEVPSGGGKDS